MSSFNSSLSASKFQLPFSLRRFKAMRTKRRSAPVRCSARMQGMWGRPRSLAASTRTTPSSTVRPSMRTGSQKPKLLIAAATSRRWAGFTLRRLRAEMTRSAGAHSISASFGTRSLRMRRWVDDAVASAVSSSRLCRLFAFPRCNGFSDKGVLLWFGVFSSLLIFGCV
jgi:hypothetical protein